MMYEKEIEEIAAQDNYQLLKTMESVANTGLPYIVHAEDNAVFLGLMAELRKRGINDIEGHRLSRPPFQETLGVVNAIFLARQARISKLILAHVSSAKALDAIDNAKNSDMSGIEILAEGRPEYFVFTSEDLKMAGAYLKTTPPLREKSDVARMWSALDSGAIDFIGSDHAPATRQEKELGRNDIWNSPSGTPSLELTIPLLLNEVLTNGRSSLPVLFRALCEKPAQVFGIYPEKGIIQIGSDADLIIIDTRLEKKVRIDEMCSKGRDCATYMEGKTLRGWPVYTISRGEVIMQDGRVDGIKNRKGEFIRPKQMTTAVHEK